jgi:Sodium:sulfate symporter transmembrane region
MGCLSTYGIGSAPPYFAAGYVPQSKWYQLGFIMSVWYLAVWLIAGGAWWKVCLGVMPLAFAGALSLAVSLGPGCSPSCNHCRASDTAVMHASSRCMPLCQQACGCQHLCCRADADPELLVELVHASRSAHSF